MPDAPAAVTFHEVGARHPHAVESMRRYFAELDERFPGGFDVGDTLTADAAALSSPTGAFVVARAGDEVVGCGGVQTLDDGVGEIKRMWVHPDHRGRGLGRALLAELEAQVARLGHTTVRLDTNSVLVEAIAMYERSGYVEIERYNDNPYAKHFFEKPLPQ